MRKTIRIVSLILSVILTLSLFFLPVFAEDSLADLKRVYNTLNAYFYTPYYKNSEKFEAYTAKMKEIKEFLSSKSSTQTEAKKYYDELRTVYAELMQDTYDYSSLQVILDVYAALEPGCFTEDSWKKLTEVKEAVAKELISPTLFSRNANTTEKEYTERIQSNIDNYSTRFEEAFNLLSVLDPDEKVSREFLSAYASYVRFCSREAYEGEVPSWKALQSALNQAENLSGTNNATQAKLQSAYEGLTEQYNAVFYEIYPLTRANETVKLFYAENADSYSPGSWKRYAEAVNLLEEKLSSPHFFYIPPDADQTICRQYADEYEENLIADANKMRGALLTIETYEELSAICKRYKDATAAVDGLTVQLNLLASRVEEGENVLNNLYASKSDVETAIANIQSAADDLKTAERNLIEEQGKIVRQDEKTMKLSLTFTLSSLALSAVFAMILSFYYFGKVDWMA